MTTALQARVAAITHVGRVRTSNEDTLVVGDMLCSAPMDRPLRVARELSKPLLCLIADGMGGHAAGEVASQLAARLGQELLPRASDENSLAEAVRSINRNVFAEMQSSTDRRGMGTTLVGMLLSNNGHMYFNVGDSRLYRFKGGFLRQLSVDDVREGVAVDGDATQKSGILTQCLGGRDSFQDIAPHVGTEPIVPEWQYLLCSDGLSDLVRVEEMETILSTDDGGAAVVALLEAALKAGGHDNISIILIGLTGT